MSDAEPVILGKRKQIMSSDSDSENEDESTQGAAKSKSKGKAKKKPGKFFRQCSVVHMP